jgi:two-component sensor histidine kinase
MMMTMTRMEGAEILPPLCEPSAADEANHRIANSLQLVAAMIAMEAHKVSDPAALAALDMTGRRIGAIAGVHRQLYQAGAGGTVDLAAYLTALGGELAGAYAGAGRMILVDAASVTVAAEEAGAIGLIVSELVINACKYAYAMGEAGSVSIALRPTAGGYRLEVADHGRGMGGGVRGGGHGSTLIQAMAKRLGGRCAWQDARPGTHFVLDVD